MQVALKRYEQDLEQKRQQHKADLKHFKEKIVFDTLAVQKERVLKKAKQMFTSAVIQNQIGEKRLQED